MGEILQVKDLKTYYYSKEKIIPAVDGVSFTLKQGESIGIVGESGCGKSTVARTVIRLLDQSYTRIEGGQVLFHGQDILKISAKEMNRIRGKKISMIFQNPLSTLNPVFTVGDQIGEVISLHNRKLGKNEVRKKVIELLRLVGIPSPEIRFHDYPHQMSGGMQQRVIIAIALACSPEIVIADEPTTALDVTIQAQILDLMKQLQSEFHMGLILITHNMGVVVRMCERILVMYGGVVVESGFTKDIFSNPSHPYTKGLLAAIPSVYSDKEELYSIPGFVPRFEHPVTRCRFCNRCGYATERCFKEEPEFVQVGEGHVSRCFLHQEKRKAADHGN